MYYLQRTASYLAAGEWSVTTDDLARLEYALLTLNNLIDANVTYLTRMGEFITDAENICSDVEQGQSLPDNDIILEALSEELADAIAEIQLQRCGMDESVLATRELVGYFLQSSAT